MVSRKTLDQYRKALLFAILWQIVPSLGCALTYGHESQTFGMVFLLLIVVPLVAGMHYCLFVEKTPRALGQSIVIAVMTAAVGALAIAS